MFWMVRSIFANALLYLALFVSRYASHHGWMETSTSWRSCKNNINVSSFDGFLRSVLFNLHGSASDANVMDQEECLIRNSGDY